MTDANPIQPPSLVMEDWGLVDYGAALARQHDRVASRLRGEIPDTFIFCQHHSVMTTGRGTDASNILVRDVPIFEVERGGDVTWHGPGQLVGYFIRLLPQDGHDLRAHLRWMEEVVIHALAAGGIDGFRVAGKTGVWIRRRGIELKVCSLGIAARNWCTYHGFALNIDADLANFKRINPCGFDAAAMTNTKECGSTLTVAAWQMITTSSVRNLHAALANRRIP